MLSRNLPKKQDGIVLIIALIMLVAMTLGGLAMIRSAHTTTAIAGNLAFQQAATTSSDIGIETAIAWLQNNVANGGLDQNITASGYTASRTAADDPSSSQDWTELWTSVWVPRGVVTVPGGPDAAGNTVQYVIQRLCNTSGNSLGAKCVISPIETNLTGNSQSANSHRLNLNGQVYYRITVRVSGPRNTVSFVQTTVAI